MARRVDLYTNKVLKEQGLEGVQYFVYDCDVHKDNEGETPSEEEKRMKDGIRRYEWARLKKYRKAGDL